MPLFLIEAKIEERAEVVGLERIVKRHVDFQQILRQNELMNLKSQSRHPLYNKIFLLNNPKDWLRWRKSR